MPQINIPTTTKLPLRAGEPLEPDWIADWQPNGPIVAQMDDFVNFIIRAQMQLRDGSQPPALPEVNIPATLRSARTVDFKAGNSLAFTLSSNMCQADGYDFTVGLVSKDNPDTSGQILLQVRERGTAWSWTDTATQQTVIESSLKTDGKPVAMRLVITESGLDLYEAGAKILSVPVSWANQLNTSQSLVPHFSFVVKGPGRPVFLNIGAPELTGLGEWLPSEQINSRSPIVIDLDETMEPTTAYRTSISVSPGTSKVGLLASKPITVDVGGQQISLDPTTPTIVEPNGIGRIRVTQAVAGLTAATIRVQTNLMEQEQYHHVFPDVELHNKINEATDGEFNFAYDQKMLGTTEQMSSESIDHIQTIVQNLNRTIQYTYNESGHGVQHDRAVLPTNLQNPHFVVSINSGSPTYKPLHPEEVPNYIAGARRVERQSNEQLLSLIGDSIEQSTNIVIHTVSRTTGDIIKTFENVGADSINTVETVGQDIVNGDFGEAITDLIHGGENLGKDLYRGVSSVATDLIDGAEQQLVLSIETATGFIQFALDHTGAVGELITALLKRLGFDVIEFLGWFADDLDWDNVVQIHSELVAKVESEVQSAADMIKSLRAQSDKFLANLVNEIDPNLAHNVQLPATVTTKSVASPSPGHSVAVEHVEWLLGRVSEGQFDSAKVPTYPTPDKTLLSKFEDLLSEYISSDGNIVSSELDSIAADFSKIFSSPDASIDLVGDELMDILRKAMVIGIEVFKLVADVLLEVLESMLEGVGSAIMEPLDIPFASSLFKEASHGEELNALGLGCLATAITMSVIEDNSDLITESPEIERMLRSELLLSDSAVYNGRAYGSFHIVLSVTSVVSDLLGVVDKPTAKGAVYLLTLTNLALSIAAQVYARPDSPIEPSPIALSPDMLNSPYQAPEYMGHVIWYVQWVGTGLSIFSVLGVSLRHTQKPGMAQVPFVLGDLVLRAITTLYGIAHMGLMATLDVKDRNKLAAVNRLLEANENRTDLEILNAAVNEGGSWNLPNTKETAKTWVANIKAFQDWGNNDSSNPAFHGLQTRRKDSGIPAKGFGNVLDSFPEIGQICGSEYVIDISESWSLIGLVGLDAFGHLGEGITYVVRTNNGELF